jgi:hypothetical protein
VPRPNGSAPSPGWPARRTRHAALDKAWRIWPTAPTTTHHRGRVRPGVPGPARQLAGGLGARLGRPPQRGGRTWPARDPAWPSAWQRLARPRDGWPGSRSRCRRTAPGTWRCGTTPGAGAVGPEGTGGGRTDRWPRDAGVPRLRRARAGAAHLPAADRRVPRPAVAGDRGTVIENAAYLVSADPRGAGRSASPTSAPAPSARRAGNELVLQDEYRSTPGTARVPGTCRPRGPARFGSGPGHGAAGALRLGSRLVASFTLDGLDVIQETCSGTTPTGGVPHPRGLLRRADRLLRVRFPADVPAGCRSTRPPRR